MLLRLIIAKAAPGSDGALTMAAIVAPPGGRTNEPLCRWPMGATFFLPFCHIWLLPAINLAEGPSGISALRDPSG